MAERTLDEIRAAGRLGIKRKWTLIKDIKTGDRISWWGQACLVLGNEYVDGVFNLRIYDVLTKEKRVFAYDETDELMVVVHV